MLRALFILLALVSFMLAIVLDMPLLYLVAGILVLVAIVILATSIRKRHKTSKQPYINSSRPADQDESLEELGITSIRPRSAGSSTARADEDVMVEPEDAAARGQRSDAARRESAASTLATERPQSTPEVEADVTSEEQGVSERAVGEAVIEEATEESGGDENAGRSSQELRALGIMDIRPRERRRDSPVFGPAEKDAANGAIGASGGVPSERLRREVLTPYLQSLQAAIAAQTVCLLREDAKSLRYHIEAIFSKNGYARSRGHFSTEEPLATPALSRKSVVRFRVGEGGVARSSLGYYMEAISPKELVLTRVPQNSSPVSYLLLADSMEESRLEGPRVQTLLVQFAKGLGLILDGGESDGAVDAVVALRPRREIINEEMQRARNEVTPLALALVYLNDAEVLAEQGEDAVEEAEIVLERRLRETSGASRVEHFGELMFGVFFNGPAAEAEAWVAALREKLVEEDGPLQGGVAIGVAFMHERHETPEDLRADATAALQESFETGASTIVE